MQCKKCGTQVPKDAVFCVRCGNYVNKDKKEITKSEPLVKKVLLFLCLFIILIVGIVIFYKVFLCKDTLKTNTSNTQNLDSQEVSQETNVDEALVEKNDLQENNIGESVKPKMTPAAVCESCMNVQVDGDYLYYLEGNMAGSSFKRFNKNTGQLEKVFKDDLVIKSNNDKNIFCAVQSFKILGDYLYFSASFRKPEKFPVAYFRIPKNGGETELLFLLPQSYMVSENEKIYFLFDDEKQIGVYDPSKDILPSFLPVMDIPIDKGYNCSPFSVGDRYLYYEGIKEGGKSYKDKNFYCVDTVTGETKKLIDSSQKGLDRIRQGIFVEDKFYYTADFYTNIILIKEYNMTTGKNTIIHGFNGMDNFFALDHDKLLFPESDYGQYSRISINELSDKNIFYEGKPYDLGTDQIEAAVNAAFGEDGEEEVIDRSKLEKYSAGLVVGYSEFYNILEDKKIKMTKDNKNPLFDIEEQSAFKRAVEFIEEYKEEDISKGIVPQ